MNAMDSKKSKPPKFDYTSDGYKRAVWYLHSIGKDDMIPLELPDDQTGFALIEKVNKIWEERHGNKG